jgi:hypothetical protein
MRTIKIFSARSWRWDQLTSGLLKSDDAPLKSLLQEKFPRAENIPKETTGPGDQGNFPKRLPPAEAKQRQIFVSSTVPIALKAQNLTALE